MKKAHNFADCE